MYGAGLGKLPRWLTPPKAVRQQISKAFGQARVVVPTPAGPVELKPSEIPGAIRGATIQLGPPKQTPIEQLTSSVPGGMGTIALAGAGLLFGGLLLFRKRKRGRRR